MPAIRYFKIRETREVSVTANSAVDAALIATAAFEGKEFGQNNRLTDVWGYTESAVRQTALEVQER